MLKSTTARLVFYAVALTLLAWSASLTYSFISNALPNSFFLVPAMGLVVFDVGMIAWLVVFLSYAQGAIQRTVAICLTVFDLIGVGLMVFAEILLDGQQLAAAPAMLGTLAIWGIGIWTFVNLAGIVAFHLGDPEARKEMAIQSEKDAIWEGALDALKNRRIDDQARLANELSAVMFKQMVSELRADKDGDGTPDVLQRGKQEPANRTPVLSDITHEELAAALASMRQLEARYSANGNGAGAGSERPNG